MRGQLDLFGGLPFGSTMETDGKPGVIVAPAVNVRGTAAARAGKAIAMILAGKGLGSRAFDDCFEMGDGADVAGLILAKIESDLDFARDVMLHRHYMEPGWIFMAQAQIERDDRAWNLGIGVGDVKGDAHLIERARQWTGKQSGR